MKTTLNYFDRLMAATTFAEANEPELAKEFAGDCKSPQASRAQSSKMTDAAVQKNQRSH